MGQKSQNSEKLKRKTFWVSSQVAVSQVGVNNTIFGSKYVKNCKRGKKGEKVNLHIVIINVCKSFVFSFW